MTIDNQLHFNPVDAINYAKEMLRGKIAYIYQPGKERGAWAVSDAEPSQKHYRLRPDGEVLAFVMEDGRFISRPHIFPEFAKTVRELAVALEMKVRRHNGGLSVTGNHIESSKFRFFLERRFPDVKFGYHVLSGKLVYNFGPHEKLE